jgi:putative ABC transport system permease protein
VYLHVRTAATTATADLALLSTLRQTIRSVDARVPILNLGTRAMARDRDVILAVLRTGAAIFAVLGVVAVLLATVGVYGLKAYLVSRRTREISIRMALGASPTSVIWLITREGLTTGLVGLAVGAGLSVLVGMGLRSMTYQARSTDLTLLVPAMLLLVAAAVFAGVLPARRAAHIEPTRALRAD